MYKCEKILFITIAFLVTSQLHVHAAVEIQRECRSEETEQDCASRGGIEAIYIFDEIDEGTLQEISYINGIIPTNIPFPIVYLNSRGGGVQAGMAIGRILRYRNATVENRDYFNPNNASECTSACVLIAAGATTRNLTHIGLHQARRADRIKGEEYKLTQLSEARHEIIYNYFREMTIAKQVIEITKNTPFHKITDIRYNPDAPFLTQPLVRLGFRMNEPDDEELSIIRKRMKKLDNNGEEGLKKQAETGNAHAATLLAYRKYFGIDGQKKNSIEAIKWFQKAADLGDARALHALGNIHSEGLDGVTKDNKTAAGYYLRAAQLGLAASQNNLAWHYYKGDGVKKNIAEAIFWVTRAVEQGEPFAYGSLGTMRFEGNGFNRDDVETYKWLKLSVLLMPDGQAKEDERAQLKIVEKKLSKQQLETANKLVITWIPLKQTTAVMRDKDDR